MLSLSLEHRKQERSRSAVLIGTSVVAVAGVLLLLKWFFFPGAIERSSHGILYLVGLVPLVLFCAGAAVLLRWRPWRRLPAIVAVGLIGFSVFICWVDLHFAPSYLTYTIAIFGIGVIYSTTRLGYALLLGGGFAVLVALTAWTLPGRMQDPNFVVQAIVVSLAYAACLLLEKQRQEADSLAARLEETNAQLLEFSLRDPLTGLYNRRYVVEFLAAKRAFALRTQTPLSVVLLDIDHFKKINDTLGHAVGDEVLRGVAWHLLAGLRDSDLAARYGGEEFLLVLPQAGVTSGVQAAQRILEMVRTSSFAGLPWSVTFSAGVAELQGDESVELLLERADQRLYLAKRTRNRIVGPP